MEITIIDFTAPIALAAILAVFSMCAVLVFGLQEKPRALYLSISLLTLGCIAVVAILIVQAYQLEERGSNLAQYAESTYGAEMTAAVGSDLLGGYDRSGKAVWSGRSSFVIIDGEPIEVRALVIDGVATLTYLEVIALKRQ